MQVMQYDRYIPLLALLDADLMWVVTFSSLFVINTQSRNERVHVVKEFLVISHVIPPPHSETTHKYSPASIPLEFQ